jgi:hypothetical protein
MVVIGRRKGNEPSGGFGACRRRRCGSREQLVASAWGFKRAGESLKATPRFISRRALQEHEGNHRTAIPRAPVPVRAESIAWTAGCEWDVIPLPHTSRLVVLILQMTAALPSPYASNSFPALSDLVPPESSHNPGYIDGAIVVPASHPMGGASPVLPRGAVIALRVVVGLVVGSTSRSPTSGCSSSWACTPSASRGRRLDGSLALYGYALSPILSLNIIPVFGEGDPVCPGGPRLASSPGLGRMILVLLLFPRIHRGCFSSPRPLEWPALLCSPGFLKRRAPSKAGSCIATLP